MNTKNKFLKIILVFALSVLLTLNIALPCFAEVVYKGDVNGDKQLNSLDTAEFYKALLCDYPIDYDANEDGKIDIRDLVRVKKLVAKFSSQEKFKVKFPNTDSYLYRVGNMNEIELGTLFEPLSDIDSAEVAIVIKQTAGSVTGTFTPNTSDWTKGKIKFEGTGVARIIIHENSVTTVLNVEVIDATNLTSAVGTTTGGNFVLLKDVNTSNYVNYWNCNLYGNGFTYSLNGAPTAYNSKQGHGIIITKNALIDNLVIEGDVYNSYGAYTNQDYYNAAVDVVGDTVIQNCYISGCAAPIMTREDVTVINSTLYGGTVANVIIKSGIVTLKDVTTANYADGRELIGMGIVIHSDATEAAKLILEGSLKQYNFICESDKPSDSSAKILYNAMFDSSCAKYHFGSSPSRYVNAGVICMTPSFTAASITDNANTGYQGTNITVNSVSGYVYTQPNTLGTVNNDYSKDNDSHIAAVQGVVAPTYSFDYTSKNYMAKTEGSNDYCYEENGVVYISMDDGETFSWDPSILTATKNGMNLNYTVSMNGTDYTGKNIVFSESGDYTVEYTYTDGNNYTINESGNITTYENEYVATVHINVSEVKASAKHAEFTFGSSNTTSKTVTIGNDTFVMPDVSATSGTIGSTSVNGTTVYYPIVEIIMSDGKTSHSSAWYAYFPVYSGAVTITDYRDGGTGDAVIYNSSTTDMHVSIVGDPSTLFKYQSSSAAGSSPVVKNNILVYSSPSISKDRSEYNTVIEYTYQDNAGTTYHYYIGYHAPAQKYSNTCVTPDTLVTLADGTQKRADSLTGDELLLVWNHETGKLDKAPVAYIVDHDDVAEECEIIHLNFENGKTVKIIGEHVFFDATLNKYVAIETENANSYIGHTFAALSEDGDMVEKIELVSVEISVEETTIYEVVSYKHLTCFTEGILSTSAYLDTLLNVFDVNADTMAYTPESVQKDIETYGLYTYADFEGLISEEAFELYNAQYLKIAVGKGYITWNDILDLIDIYFGVDVQPIN